MRTVRNVTFVLMCALIYFAGGAVVRAESGGFYCGYGDCTLLYSGCNWANYDDLGGGECRITTAHNEGCTVSYSCTGEEFGWIEEHTSSSFRVGDLIWD